MDAIMFLKEWQRMCNHTICVNCPSGSICVKSGMPYEMKEFDGMVLAVAKWSAEHPKKTRMKDFWEKHPKAPKTKDNRPAVCAKIVGYCDVCQRNECGDADCERCWEQPLEE